MPGLWICRENDESSVNRNQGQSESKQLTLILFCQATSGIPVCSAGRGAEVGQ